MRAIHKGDTVDVIVGDQKRRALVYDSDGHWVTVSIIGESGLNSYADRPIDQVELVECPHGS